MGAQECWLLRLLENYYIRRSQTTKIPGYASFLFAFYTSCGGEGKHQTPKPVDSDSESSQHGYGQSEHDRALLANNLYHPLVDLEQSRSTLVMHT
jgi:hypothetical protein